MGVKLEIRCQNEECFVKYISSNELCWTCPYKPIVDFNKLLPEIAEIKDKTEDKWKKSPYIIIKGGKITNVIYE